jgi:hypothetical protein
MNIRFKQAAIFAVALIAAVFFAGCEKDDSSAGFGFGYIFMPQATVANKNYLVPQGKDSTNFNYIIEDANVKVLLGVSRSGKIDAEAYSVSIKANADTVTQLIANGLIKVDPDKAKVVELLPADAYTLPQKIDVAAGKVSGSFYLTIDKAKLKTYAGKKVALGVEVNNPSKYMLNQAINKVVVIINVDALKLL